MEPATAWCLVSVLLNAGAFAFILWFDERQRRAPEPVDTIFVGPEQP